jgi:hypothetical protein
MKHDLRNLPAVGFAELLDKVGDLNDRQQHFLLRLRQTL